MTIKNPDTRQWRTAAAATAAQADPVPALVAKVYAEAPPTERGRLLEHLLKPLSLLSLAAVANGIFAKMTLGNGWPTLKVSPEDASRVDVGDVMTLVSYVQQVSLPAIGGLSKVIAASPVLMGSAAAAMLLGLLANQAKIQTPIVGDDYDPVV